MFDIPDLGFVLFGPLRIELDFGKICWAGESNIKIEVWIEGGFNIIVAIFNERFDRSGSGGRRELPVFRLQGWITR